MMIKDQTVVSVSLVTAVCLLGNSMLYVTLPLYWQEAGLNSLWEVSIILSVNRVVRLPLNAFVGWLYSKIKIRPALVAAVALAAAATWGYGIFSGFKMWLILRTLWGISWSLLKLGGFLAVISEAGEDDRGRLMGKYNGLHRLGDFFGLLAGGVLTGILGFKTTLVLFGFFIFLVLPVVFFLVPNYRVFDTKNIKAESGLNLSFAVIRVMAGGLIIALLFEGIVASTLSLFVARHYQESIFIAGFCITAAALSGFLLGIRWLWEPFLASLIGGWSDRQENREVLFLPFLALGAIGFFITALDFPLPLPVWIGVVLLLMVTATALVTLSDSLASDIAKQKFSVRIIAIYTIVLDIGAALGPFMAYQLITLQTGLFYPYLLGGILLLTVLVLWIVPPAFRKQTLFK
ncbi:MAG: MFS transporter [Peptococcaceae bacterium]